VRVVLLVRDDERVVRQLIVRQMRRELRERHDIVCLSWAVDYIREIGKRIVPFDIWIHVAIDVAS